MRVALCDDPTELRWMVESLLARLGHELVGIADTTVGAIGLLETARPDAVILDLSLGYDTDFDVIATALAMDASVIVFAHNADTSFLNRYTTKPRVVPKPDLVMLEDVLRRLEAGQDHASAGVDRRQRPPRVAVGTAPTGPADAPAYYEAINSVREGDALVSVDGIPDGIALAQRLSGYVRTTDRYFGAPNALRVYIPGGGQEGVASLLARLHDERLVSRSATIRSVIVRADEDGVAAFERLKSDGDVQELPLPS